MAVGQSALEQLGAGPGAGEAMGRVGDYDEASQRGAAVSVEADHRLLGALYETRAGKKNAKGKNDSHCDIQP